MPRLSARKSAGRHGGILILSRLLPRSRPTTMNCSPLALAVQAVSMRRQAAIWTAAGTAAGTGVPRKTCIGAGQQGDAVVIDYAKILTELEEERAACQYVYGGMIPAFYTQALHRAIEAVKECQDCAAEAGRMAKEVSRHDMA